MMVSTSTERALRAWGEGGVIVICQCRGCNDQTRFRVCVVVLCNKGLTAWAPRTRPPRPPVLPPCPCSATPAAAAPTAPTLYAQQSVGGYLRASGASIPRAVPFTQSRTLVDVATRGNGRGRRRGAAGAAAGRQGRHGAPRGAHGLLLLLLLLRGVRHRRWMDPCRTSRGARGSKQTKRNSGGSPSLSSTPPGATARAACQWRWFGRQTSSVDRGA